MKIAPSILAANFMNLGEEIKDVENGGADYIHIDIMDGHFVPNITMGPLIVQAARRITDIPLDVHLMIAEPSRYIEDFVNAGADIITVHIEADNHIHRTIQQIKSMGRKAGVVLNPATPISSITSIIEDIDMVLLMTVNPGFGGQTFIESVLKKIRELRLLIESKGLQVDIEVDGGIDVNTIGKCKEAGANIFVAGTAIFGQADRHEAIKDLRLRIE